MRCLTKALEIRPDFPSALAGLGNLHFAAKRLEDAAVCYRKAIALDPGVPDTHVNLGHVLKNQGRVQEELACYQAALALNPDFVAARWSLAMSRISGVPEAHDEPKRERAQLAADLEALERWLDASRERKQAVRWESSSPSRSPTRRKTTGTCSSAMGVFARG